MEILYRPGNRPGQLVVEPAGDLDLYAAVNFGAEVIAKIDSGNHRIVIDFGGIRYLDSSGVGVLIRLLQKLRLVRGDLRLARLSGTPLRVLEMSNIISLLPHHPDVASALAVWSGL